MSKPGTGARGSESTQTMSHVHEGSAAGKAQEKVICVVGLGYIGLPTASLLASRGFEVHGVDVNKTVVDTIKGGGIHIREPELDVMVRSGVDSGRLRAHLETVAADIFILAVPTPFKGGYEPDLSYVEAATRAVATKIKRGDLVILESTSPVGTTEKISQWLSEERPDLAGSPNENSRNGCPGLLVAHCPERVLPGQIMRELIENDRVVGGVDEASTQAAVEFYKTFVSGEILATDSRTAEMSKLAENTFRDINIAYANELSMICDKLEINAWELIRLANHHPRVNILQPGPGVGGHCIAVDPWFIVSEAPEVARLIQTARQVNDHKPRWVIEKIQQAVGKVLQNEHDRTASDVTLACLGLTFKPNIDDLRESPSLQIAEQVAESHPGRVLVVEPNIEILPEGKLGGCRLASVQEAVDEADIVVLLVDHREFYDIPGAALEGKILIDTRGIWTA